MDFSKVKSITIPEGVVTQIADASGRVLWSAVKMATVAIRISNPAMFNNNVAKISINGIDLATPYVEESTYSLNIGDIIEFAITSTSNIPVIVYINGEMVQSNNPVIKQYTYSIKSNATIECLASGHLMVYITEDLSHSPLTALNIPLIPA